MKITQKGNYAVKAILDLAVHYEKGVVTIQAIAKRIDAPSKFLEQVLVELKRGGFIESRRGKIGWYRLSKSPKTITLGDVVKFIDGPLEPAPELNREHSERGDIYKRIFKPIWKKVFQVTSDVVNHVTFEDLARQIESIRNVPTYYI